MDDRTDFQRRLGVGERQHVFGRVAGSDEVLSVKRDDNGQLAGKQINHWDGSQSAVAMPSTGHGRIADAPRI